MIKALFFSLVIFGVTSCATPTTMTPNVSNAELNAEKAKQNEIVAKEQIKKRREAAKKRIGHQQRLNAVSAKILEGGLELCTIMLNKTAESCLYEFELTKSGSVNAAADGKKIYITPAMMNFAKTEEELAVVLGHEYAHNLMGHIESQKGNALLGGLLGALLDGVAASQGANTNSGFSRMGANAAILTYSADFEKEADYVGLYVMALSGYDIKDAPNFWRRMSINNPKAVYQQTTHPTNSHRFIALEKAVNEINSKKEIGMPLHPEIQPKQSAQTKKNDYDFGNRR